MSHTTPEILATIDITSLTDEGLGLGIWNLTSGLQRPCIVPCSLPTESVTCSIHRTKKSKQASFIGDVISVEKASPDRATPQCKHFSLCGGCTWQHMKYDAQTREKEAHVRALFAADVPCFPIMRCEAPYGFRNKMEFSFSEDVAGKKFLGLIIRKSRGRVFNVEECHLMQPWINPTLDAVRVWWQESGLKAFYMPKNLGSLRTLTLREGRSGDRLIMLTVSGNPDYAMTRAQLDSFTETCRHVATPPQGNLSCILRIHQAIKGQPTQMYEMRLFGPDSFREQLTIDGRPFEFLLSPSSFFQPNSFQASRLYSRALELAELSPDTVLYDLYAGIGIFGMLASTRAKEVISIELSKDSAFDAKTNADRLGLSNFRMIQGDVAKVLLQNDLPEADVAIVDPPRCGLGASACEQILKLKPKRLVYVSCNPTTQAQDVALLVQGGMKLIALQPIDQFPQSIHIENIAVLQLATI